MDDPRNHDRDSARAVMAARGRRIREKYAFDDAKRESVVR